MHRLLYFCTFVSRLFSQIIFIILLSLFSAQNWFSELRRDAGDFVNVMVLNRQDNGVARKSLITRDLQHTHSNDADVLDSHLRELEEMNSFSFMYELVTRTRRGWLRWGSGGIEIAEWFNVLFQNPTFAFHLACCYAMECLYHLIPLFFLLGCQTKGIIF